MGPAFVETLSVGKFHGIGPVTAARMNALGIYTGLDLRRQSLALLTARFGKAGGYYYAAPRGEDHRPVVAERQRKSLGAEMTFARHLLDWDEVPPGLSPLIDKLWGAYSRDGLAARTLVVKVKYADFQQITRSRSCTEAIMSRAAVEQLSLELLRPLFPPRRGVRLLGVTLSNFDADNEPAERQLVLVLK